MLAALTLTFDPVLRLSDTASVRWETVALALVLFLGLLLAAWTGSRTLAVPDEPAGARLRVDDFVFIVVGAVPGAIVGGRLGYVLDHLDYYKANPAAVVDPSQGGFTLTLAVPLAILTGAVIARLLSAAFRRWMGVIAPILLFVLAGGKLVGVLGATGQGAPSDLPWATSYAGPGPWATLAADLSSHPAQVYEAIAVSVAIVLLYRVSRTAWVRRRDGAMLYAALGLWALARFLVAFSWRDAMVAGPLRMEQLMLLAVMVVAAIGLARESRRATPVSGNVDEPVPMANDEDSAAKPEPA